MTTALEHRLLRSRTARNASLAVFVAGFLIALPASAQAVDTDDDGFNDGFEVAKGSDPLDPLDTPVLNVPALGPFGLGMLALMLGLATAIVTRRGRAA